MRYLLTILCFLLLFTSIVHAQTDLGFSFQGYARKTDGSAVSSESVRVQFSIYEEGNSADFMEVHSLTTDAYGVYTTEVGTVNAVDFLSLNWDAKSYKLKVELSVNGGNFVQISDKAFNAVPYAKTAGNGVPPGTIVPFAGEPDKVPTGWTICDGRLLDKTDAKYARLFNTIGGIWGQEGNSFRTPDFRGAFLRGAAGGQLTDPDRDGRYAKYTGGAAGDRIGSFQNHVYDRHDHGVTDRQHWHTVGPEFDPGHNHNNGSFDVLLTFGETNTITANVDNDGSRTEPSLNRGGLIQSSRTGIERVSSSYANVSVDANGGNETRPYNASVLYIIKL